jgi:Phosphotransferase enzyme family
MDAAVPGLGEALDAAEMVAHLHSMGVEARWLSADPIRHKPGERCTIRYRLSTASGERDLYGKVFVGGVPQIAAVASALAEASRGDARLPMMMPVVGVVERLSLVIFEACPNALEFHSMALDPRIDSGRRTRLWTAFGEALAALHASNVRGLPRHDKSADFVELNELGRIVRVHDPRLADRFTTVAEWLAALPAGTDRLASSHGALRADQVLISDGRIALVDLDCACLANPARDLGNLIAYLRWRVVREVSPLELVSAAVGSLQLGYLSAGGAVERQELDYWRAASMLKIIGRRFAADQVDEWTLTPRLLDDAERLIA